MKRPHVLPRPAKRLCLHQLRHSHLPHFSSGRSRCKQAATVPRVQKGESLLDDDPYDIRSSPRLLRRPVPPVAARAHYPPRKSPHKGRSSEAILSQASPSNPISASWWPHSPPKAAIAFP